MKKFSLFVVSAVVLSTSSFAATVKGAKIIGDQLIVNVRHGGGCGDHKYDLKLEGCFESMPVQCNAKLIHKSNDPCEAIISREAKFSLKKLGLTGDYYAGGSLTISGDQGSSATVTLSGSSEVGVVKCTTHTGSKLRIDSNTGTVTLKTTAGESASYEITDVRALSLESNPPIAQTTYSLDDGRKIVTEFVGSSDEGTGHFIRTNGQASPDFESCTR